MRRSESGGTSTQELAARIQAAVETAERAFRDDRRHVASGHLFDAIQIALSAPPGELRLKSSFGWASSARFDGERPNLQDRAVATKVTAKS